MTEKYAWKVDSNDFFFLGTKLPKCRPSFWYLKRNQKRIQLLGLFELTVTAHQNYQQCQFSNKIQPSSDYKFLEHGKYSCFVLLNLTNLFISTIFKKILRSKKWWFKNISSWNWWLRKSESVWIQSRRGNFFLVFDSFLHCVDRHRWSLICCLLIIAKWDFVSLRYSKLCFMRVVFGLQLIATMEG